ncbi:hypothetical protein C4579_01455 [Candidatus Microgenomates bacterium]|nr:MAG: hypothetical protein C4579_01455 [Candidatus Microgenomates bacterium]
MQFLFSLVIAFSRNVWGSVQTPYSTYRRLTHETLLQLPFVFALVAAYFFLVSPIKLHTLHPLLLTVNATRLFVISVTTYLGISGFLLLLGSLVGGRGKIESMLMAWGYSLLPTLVWFTTTTLFYVLLPPPRTHSLPGTLFSLLYITFSLSLFLWKGILYYLTLRFALKLDMKRIIGVSVVFLPTLAIYSLIMYYVGVFKVPFI